MSRPSRSRRLLLGLGGALGAAAFVGWARGGLRQQPTAQGSKLKAPSLTLKTRQDWGATPPNHVARAEFGFYDAATNPGGWRIYDQPLALVLRTVVVHHSALPLSDGPREIQVHHLKGKGYADIGYHFVIDAAGEIYEGRPLNVRGAHVGGFNTGCVGLCLLGNFEEAASAPDQLTSLEALVGALKTQFNITHLAGHRDFQPAETVCPGKSLEPLLPHLATKLGLQFGTDGYRRD